MEEASSSIVLVVVVVVINVVVVVVVDVVDVVVVVVVVVVLVMVVVIVSVVVSVVVHIVVTAVAVIVAIIVIVVIVIIVGIVLCKKMFFIIIFKCAYCSSFLDVVWDTVPDDWPRFFYHFCTIVVIRAFSMKSIGMLNITWIKILSTYYLSPSSCAVIMDFIVIREPLVKIYRALED